MSTNPEKAHTSETIGAESAQVERWEPVLCYSGDLAYVKMWPHPDASYIRLADFEAVTEERDRLRAALEIIAKHSIGAFGDSARAALK